MSAAAACYSQDTVCPACSLLRLYEMRSRHSSMKFVLQLLRFRNSVICVTTLDFLLFTLQGLVFALIPCVSSSPTTTDTAHTAPHHALRRHARTARLCWQAAPLLPHNQLSTPAAAHLCMHASRRPAQQGHQCHHRHAWQRGRGTWPGPPCGH